MQRSNETANRKTSLPIDVLIGTENEETKQFGTIFLPQENDNENQWEQWLQEMSPLFLLDPLEVQNHKEIAKHYGVEKKYKDMVAQHNDKTRLDKFFTLLYVIQRKKQISSTTEKRVNASISNTEGNHRVAAMIHSLLGSKYNGIDGILERETLTKEWMATVLENEKIKNAKGTPSSWIKAAVDDSTSMYREKIRVKMRYGITEEDFNRKGVCMEDVRETLVTISRTLSDHKRESVVPPETMAIGEALQDFMCTLYTATENIKKQGSGLTPTFSSKGKCYIECMTEEKSSEEPEICEIFERQQMKDFQEKPTKTTLEALCQNVEASLLSNNDGELLDSGMKATGPFWLDELTVAHANGNYLRRETTKTTKEKGTKKSVTVKLPKHWPLGVEDFNKILIVGMIFYPIYRAFHRIHANEWEHSVKREDAKKELIYLQRKHCTSSTVEKMGKKPTPAFLKSDMGEFIQKDNPLTTGKEHWAATLLIADIIVAQLCGEAATATETINDFIALFLKVQDEEIKPDDYDIVYILGKMTI